MPFPQYNQINARQTTEGLNRYNAGVIEFTRRLSGGFVGRFNYTYSVLKDNYVGEGNFYTAVSPGMPVNNYNYVASMPRCAPGQQFTTACYDPAADGGLRGVGGSRLHRLGTGRRPPLLRQAGGRRGVR